MTSVTSAETILLVEDEPAIRGMMTGALRAAGYRVIEARNGLEALDLFNGTIDLLLTDMRMPHLGGEELIAQLVARRHTLKVLSFSGYALSAPVNADAAFIEKPFSRDVLLKTVRRVLNGR